MKHILSILIVTSSLTGCSLLGDTIPEPKETLTHVNTRAQGNFHFQENTNAEINKVNAFEDKVIANNINFYMRGLMQDLISNLQYVNNTTPIAVTSFVLLDSNLQQTNLLGNQITESLMHEIHKAGIPVLDFKVTDSLRITQQGDFISSRDFNDLSTNIPIQYIVKGNLVKHQGGYLVNARVVGISSKAVVASAQSFIPAHVAKALLSSKPVEASGQRENQIPLIQG
jgi:TolB-like protein